MACNTFCLSAGSVRMRAMETAPAIALKMTKKFRSRSVAVAPGMSSTQMIPALLDQAGNSSSDTDFGASHFGRQGRNRTAGFGMITVLG